MWSYLLFLLILFIATFLAAFLSCWLTRLVLKKHIWLSNIVALLIGICAIYAAAKYSGSLVNVRANSPDAGGLAWLAESILTIFAVLVTGIPGYAFGITAAEKLYKKRNIE